MYHSSRPRGTPMARITRTQKKAGHLELVLGKWVEVGADEKRPRPVAPRGGKEDGARDGAT